MLKRQPPGGGNRPASVEPEERSARRAEDLYAERGTAGRGRQSLLRTGVLVHGRGAQQSLVPREGGVPIPDPGGASKLRPSVLERDVRVRIRLISVVGPELPALVAGHDDGAREGEPVDRRGVGGRLTSRRPRVAHRQERTLSAVAGRVPPAQLPGRRQDGGDEARAVRLEGVVLDPVEAFGHAERGRRGDETRNARLRFGAEGVPRDDVPGVAERGSYGDGGAPADELDLTVRGGSARRVRRRVRGRPR